MLTNMENTSAESPNRIDRRAAIKWMGAVVAAATVSDNLLGATKEPGAKAIAGAGKIIGTDPVLNKTYTTPQGMKDVGYVGNVPSVDFAGPTPEALKHLGLA
ncbi:MAG: hypothetical protein EBR83_03075 [Verrucomicrobia bacterium]|nr:hypothetical protein [Verrucomicrobiota bacterium]